MTVYSVTVCWLCRCQLTRLHILNDTVMISMNTGMYVDHFLTLKVSGYYRRTSSVDAMLTELNWQSLADIRRIARLVMFYKIHHHLVAINMPLESKLLPAPTRTENSLAYVIPTSSRDYHLYSFYPRTVRDWNYLPQDLVQLCTPEAFRSALTV